MITRVMQVARIHLECGLGRGHIGDQRQRDYGREGPPVSSSLHPRERTVYGRWNDVSATDSGGLGNVLLLPVGNDSIGFSAPGFTTTKFPGVSVGITETTRISVDGFD